MKLKDRSVGLMFCVLLVIHSVAFVEIASGATERPIVDTSVTAFLDSGSYAPVVIVLEKRGDVPEIVKVVSDNEFVPTHVFNNSRWLGGYLSMDGLQHLLSRDEVRRVYVPPRTHLLLSESAPLIGATDVRHIVVNETNITGSNETICVVDSGVNKSHPALQGKVIGEHCFCRDIFYIGCCPNGLTEDTDATDGSGHGTHVAGIVAANGEVKGIAFNSNIVAVRVTDSQGSGYEWDLDAGIEWCRENMEEYNITGITISIGATHLYDNSSSCDTWGSATAVNDAAADDILVTVMSGNTGNLTHIELPSCASNATSVGAVFDADVGSDSFTSEDYNCTDSSTYSDKITCYSNRASILDILAPGSVIYSTTLNGYGSARGTSCAAPHIAGSAALLRQYERLKNNRTLTPAEIENRLKDTGKLIFDNETNLSFPRIDVYAALFPIDVYDFRRFQASNTHNVFGFKIKNNYNNKTKDVSWSFDIGNGTVITSNNNISLPPGNTSFVYFEHNYTDGDIYTVEASASSGDVSDSETMTLILGDIIAYDLSEIYTNAKERVFKFKILNNMNTTQTVNWTMNTWEQSISADKLTILDPSNESFVYFHYNYTSECAGCWIYARVYNGSISDYTNFIRVDVQA